MKKKVGVIVEGYSCSEQLYELISLSQKAKNYQVTHLIINQYNEKSHNITNKVLSLYKTKGLSYIVSAILFKIIFEVEKLLFLPRATREKFFKKSNLRDFGLNDVFVTPILSESKIIYRYNNDDINSIKAADLDLLIRAGNGILKGEILEICPEGIVSFHHGNNNLNRGGPPGFWEVLLRQPSTGFIIQRLTAELDGGNVLFRGAIPTKFNYIANLVALQRTANRYLVKVIDNIFSENLTLSTEERLPYSYPLYKKPRIREQLSYVLKTALLVVDKVINRLLNRRFRWGVAYQFTNNWRDAVLWKSNRIKNPKNRFLADPFIIKKQGEHYCFLEDYDYSLRRGRIAVYKINEEGYTDLGVAIDEKFHLSYPFLFQYSDELYMCPETHENRDIRIYKCVSFPLEWELEKILIQNVKAADTDIFERNGRWWMLTSVANSDESDCSSTLHVYSAANPLSDDWIEHQYNPVIFDSCRARNAGLIVEPDTIYRVSQKQGFDRYGAALDISEIQQLDDFGYRERWICSIEPNFFQGLHGTHTLNFDGELLVFDYLKREYKNVSS